MNYEDFVSPRGALTLDAHGILHPYFGNLPKEYIAFLQCTNGGEAKKGYFIMPSGEEGFIDEYLGLLELSPHNCHDLRWYALYYEGRPPDMVQIATDETSSFLLLSTSEENYGAIYTWHREDQVLRFVAPSFNDFLKIVEDLPEDL